MDHEPVWSPVSALTSTIDGFKHQTECHDPLSAVRKDRGEKIVRST